MILVGFPRAFGTPLSATNPCIRDPPPSKTRAFGTPSQVVKTSSKEQVVGAATPVDSKTRTKTGPQKGILRGKGCTKKRFCNTPDPDGLSKG